MIKKILEWLLSFFLTDKENDITKEIKKVDEKIKEVDNEEMSTNDINDYLNK